jgi:membrane-bound metal-dependent hydrolase YbcI (DUF457 family)
MNGATHLAGGLMAGAILGADPRLLISGVVALVPDWLQVNVPGGRKLASGTFGHRGISHWLLSAGAVTLATRWLVPDLTWFVLAGWTSHILLDMFSDGAPALWPLPRITLAHIKSGSWMDALIGGALLVMAVAVTVWRLT